MTSVEPDVALRWLAQARRGLVGAQASLLVLAAVGSPVRVPFGPLVALLSTIVVADAVESIRLRRRPVTMGTVRLHIAQDLVALTGILLLTGGAENPLQAFFLVDVALVAIVLPTGGAWVTTGMSMLLQAVAVVTAPDLPGLDEVPHEHLSHLAGHVVAFDIAAIAVTAFVGRLSAALRASEADRAGHEKLAALGTLAAGTAHALATPMGAIELLAEEAALDVPAGAEGHRALAALRGEVRRCRLILDRMLAGDEGADGTTDAVARCVRDWVEEWTHAQDAPVRLELSVDAPDVSVRGGEDGWRDALWTVLDNARAAGDPIYVRLMLADAGGIHLVVEDAGPPVPPDDFSRAGQPFFSAWRGRKGTGLGLFVARTYARAAGGDVQLAAGERGARAEMVMVRA
jgi:two-component system sensor histidine kinase RegB